MVSGSKIPARKSPHSGGAKFDVRIAAMNWVWQSPTNPETQHRATRLIAPAQGLRTKKPRVGAGLRGPNTGCRARRSDRANDWHRAGARQDRLAEPGLEHPPPGDAGTARRGVKTVESSAVFQPKQWAEKKPGRQSKTGPNPNLCPRTLFDPSALVIHDR
jgi:hypothetical protein